MRKLAELSVVVPVFNEEDVLPELFSRLSALECAGELEVVFVNDGSTDQSAVLLQDARRKIPSARVEVLEFARNFGHSAAVFAGIVHARAHHVALMDADLQDPPELLIEMLKTLKDRKLDGVYGRRIQRKEETFFKKATAWVFYRLLRLLSEVPIPPDAGDFRIFTKEVQDILVQAGPREPFLRGLIAWLGFHQAPFDYVREARAKGNTKYSLRKMVRFATMGFLSFSFKPLKCALYAGFIGFLTSVILSLYAIHGWWIGSTVPGWVSLVLVITFLQSFVFVLLGVHGLYLSKLLEIASPRPQFVLRKRAQSVLDENALHDFTGKNQLKSKKIVESFVSTNDTVV